MKLQSAGVICVFILLGSSGSQVSGTCVVSNTENQTVYWYRCYATNDYSMDIEAAPVDISRVTLSKSRIPVLRDRSFSRLSNALEKLEISFSNIGKIEDNAFEGLSKLNALEIKSCNLEMVKSAWVRGLTNLETVSFMDNKIRSIEPNFFSILPPLKAFDIALNELTCLSPKLLGNFKTEKFFFQLNSLTWECMYALVKWVRENDVQESDFERGNFDPSAEVLLVCEEKLLQHHDQLNTENMKKCVETTLNSLLPDKKHYTMGYFCGFLKEHPSPFVSCHQE